MRHTRDSTLLSFVFSSGLVDEISTVSTGATISAIYLGVFPTTVAYVTYAYALSRLSASRTTSFLYLAPVSAIIIAYLWLGEVPTLLSLSVVQWLAGVSLVNARGGRSVWSCPMWIGSPLDFSSLI